MNDVVRDRPPAASDVKLTWDLPTIRTLSPEEVEQIRPGLVAELRRRAGFATQVRGLPDPARR